MLSDKLREGAQGKIFKVLFWIIILSFIFAGVGGYLIPRLNTDPVKVGDYSITSAQWNEQYNRETQQMHRMLGGEASKLLENPEYVRALRTRVLESMIDNVALTSAVYQTDVRIGDEQVREVIRNTPAFQRDGKFDNNLYLASVRNMGMDPEYFGQQLRLTLMTDFIAQPAINTAAAPLPYEITSIGRLLSEYRVVDLYSLDLSHLQADLSASAEEIQAWYDSHHAAYMAPAEVKFTYILLDTDTLKKEVSYTDDDLQNYLSINQEDFRTPEKRAVRHILIKNDAADSAERTAAVEAALAEGQDFATVASIYSEDLGSRDNGGLMGELSRDDLAANLSDAAFALQEGEISAKVADSFGTHFLKVDKIIPPSVPAFESIRSRVAAAYVADRARDLYQEKLNTMSDLTFENPDSLDIAAESLGLTVYTCNGLAQGDASQPWPLNTQALQDAAFTEENYTSGINSPVINLSDTAAVTLNIFDYQAAELRELSEVQEQVSAAVVHSKAVEQGRSILTEFAASLQEDPNTPLPADVSLNREVRLERGTSVVDPQFGMAIFAIAREGSRPYTIGDNKGRETLAVLKETGSADDNALAGYETLLRAQLQQYNSSRLQAALNQEARSLNDIEYNEEAIRLVNQQNRDLD